VGGTVREWGGERDRGREKHRGERGRQRWEDIACRQLEISKQEDCEETGQRYNIGG
jgi:hypothetical protein